MQVGWKTRLRSWRNEPYMMYLFLFIQLLIYILMEVYGLFHGLGMSGSEYTSVLMKFGAISWDSVIVYHQWWRLVTPIFVHIGFAHIAINSITLYFIGEQIENLFGHWRFFIIYLLSGILGNAMSLALGNVHTVSAGASTSLFGLFAVFLILGRMCRYNAAIQNMSRSMGIFIVMNLVFNLFSPTVDILGHIGGVLGGLLATYIVSIPVYQTRILNIQDAPNTMKRIIAGAIYIGLFILFLVIALTKYSFY